MNWTKLRLEFHPTGEGHILCKRFPYSREGRLINRPVADILYGKNAAPMGLTDDEQAEFELAMEMEFGT